MTQPDFRALAQELLQHARVAQKVLIWEGIWDDDDDQDEGLFDHVDKALATPPPEPPTAIEIIDLSIEIDDAGLGTVEFARAVLERWGHA